MSFRTQLTFWMAALAVFVIVLWLLSEILLPFVAGMALAYFLDPLVKRLQQAHVNRTLATVLVIGLFIIAFLLLVILIIPILGAQLTAFIENIPSYVARIQGRLGSASSP
jgi:predicted PurR-regulated permease PerM